MLSQKNDTETSSGAEEASYGYGQKKIYDYSDAKLPVYSESTTSNSPRTSVLGKATTKASQTTISVTVNVGLSADKRLIREANNMLSGDAQKTTLASS